MFSKQINFLFCWLLYITIVESKKSTTQKPDVKECIPLDKEKQSVQRSLEIDIDFYKCNFDETCISTGGDYG